MSSKTNVRPRRARVKPAEGRTMMEAPSAGSSELILDDAATISQGESRRIAPNSHPTISHNQIKILSAANNSAIVDAACAEELFGNPIDTSVHAAVVDSGMSDKPVLRAQLEGMETAIAELRQQELAVDDELADAQGRKDDLVEARAALEEAVVLLRKRLGRPASAIVVELSTNRPAKSQPVTVVPRRRLRHGTRRDQFRAVLEPLMIANGGTAGRQAIRQAWLEAGLFEDMENIDSVLSGALHHLRNAGYIDTDYHGTWTWIGLR
jgi:hypothetical protein